MDKTANLLKIQIGGLSEGIHRYEFQVPSTDLSLDERFPSEVDVDVSIDKTPNQLMLTASIRTRATFECDRCLTLFDDVLTPSYRMYYLVEGTDEAGIDPTEMQVIPPSLHVIDLTDDVRQTLLLCVPLKLLCGENCRGLCPECGKNLNVEACDCAEAVVDPRWEPLKRILKN